MIAFEEISDEDLNRRMALVKPLVRRGGKLWQIKSPDPRKTAFPWDPELTEPAGDVEVVTSITTLHTFGYRGLFKPSIAEVLAKTSDDLAGRADFYVVDGPKHAADLNKQADAVDAGYHIATTTFYKAV